MDQTSVQSGDVVNQLPPTSNTRKILLMVLAGFLILLAILLSLSLFFSSAPRKENIPTPTPRPTATPFPPPPTLPVATKAVATNSAVVNPTKIGRLAFIKNGDTYHSDMISLSLLVKNATAAADKLSWSPMGNFLTWRPVSSGTPSVLTIYDREKKTSEYIKPSGNSSSELIDFAWSTDEKNIAVLYKDLSFHIDLISKISSSSSQLLSLLNRASPIKQVIFPNSKTIIFSGDDGISSIDISSPIPKALVDSPSVLRMKLSFDKSKLLYSVGTDIKSDLYIMNIDGSGIKIIPKVAGKVDMGTTNLPQSTLNSGYLPYALWFPRGDKLLVGYHYLTNLPLVGIYDLAGDSFTALSAFPLYENDLMVDDLRLVGSRINTNGNTPSWQISFFTIEDNAKLATIRVISEAHSPAFFGNDLLPERNVF